MLTQGAIFSCLYLYVPAASSIPCDHHSCLGRCNALVLLEALTLAGQAVNRAMRRVTSEKEHKPLASVDHHKLQALDADNRRAQQYVPAYTKAACKHVLIMT